MAILRSPNFAEATPPWLVQEDDDPPQDDEDDSDSRVNDDVADFEDAWPERPHDTALIGFRRSR